MNKPLIFRNRAYGGELAQRDKIEYEIRYSQWLDGKKTEVPYYVTRFDKINKDHISTDRVKRFATSEQAKQYCQDMYDGKIDLSSLRAEIQADIEDRERKKTQIERDEAEIFKGFLCEKGVSLPDFLELVKLWENTNSDSRSLLYREAEDIQE